MKASLIFLLSLISYVCSSQTNYHSDLLRSNFYEQQAKTMNCDSSSGSNPEHALCLYMQLQILDNQMDSLLATAPNSLPPSLSWLTFQKDQREWLAKRRESSYEAAAESSGYYRDILILDSRVQSTKMRFEELSRLLFNR